MLFYSNRITVTSFERARPVQRDAACSVLVAMEPFGTLALFQRSLGYNLRYKYLISDGDSKTFPLLSHEQVYGTGPEDQVEKFDCVGHVQKRLGTALRNLKVQYRGQRWQNYWWCRTAHRLSYQFTQGKRETWT